MPRQADRRCTLFEAAPVGGGPPARADAPGTRLCVLASSSGGNCSVMIHSEAGLQRVTMIDAGLSPLRTRALLARLGLDFSCIDDVLLTHLDSDHFHAGWVKRLPAHARLHIHRRHAPRAMADGLPRERFLPFEEAVRLRSGWEAAPVLLPHDEWGVVAFRLSREGDEVGYATDLGRVTPALVEGLRGVGVLAIESNYCPRMQAQSPRPEFLKRRITSGAGHLSNRQCREAVDAIAPRAGVVLLHLSRQCNTPQLAASEHEGASYGLVISAPDRPTGLVPVSADAGASPAP